MPNKAYGYDNAANLQQQRRTQGKHAAFKATNPTRQKRSKAAQVHSKRLDPRLGALLALMIVGQYGSAAASEISSRSSGHIDSGPGDSSRHSGRSERAERKPTGRYARNADSTALEQALADAPTAGKSTINQQAYAANELSSALGLPPGEASDDQTSHRSEGKDSTWNQADTLFRERRSAGSGGHGAARHGAGSEVQLDVAKPPLSFLAHSISTIPTRPEMTLHRLLNAGLNPWQNVTVGRETGGARLQTTMSMHQAALEISSQQVWMGGYTYPDEITRLPDATTTFYAYIDSRIESDSRDLAGAVITDLYIEKADLSKPATVHLIQFKKPLVRASERFPIIPSQFGYILEVETVAGEKQFFAVAVRHEKKMVWSIPSDPAEREDWVTLNHKLFFDDGELVDITRGKTHSNVADAVEGMSRSIMSSALTPLKESHLGRTSFEKMVHATASWAVPFYTTFDAIKKGAYWEAFTNSVITAFIEVFAGPAMKLAGKALAHAGKVMGVTAKAVANMVVERMGQFSVRQMIQVAGRDAVKRVVGGSVRHTLADITKQAIDKSNRQLKTLGHNMAQEIVETAVDDVLNQVMGRTHGARVVANQLGELNDIIIKHPKFAKYIAEPMEKCADALGPVAHALKDAGYQVRYRGMEIWSDGMSVIDVARSHHYPPKTHFVVIAKRGGNEFVVDITAAQFRNFGFNEPIIAPMHEWLRRYREASNIVYIRYADFKGKEKVLDVFHPARNRNILQPIEEGAAVDLVKPRWWNNLDEAIKARAGRPTFNDQHVPEWRKHAGKKRRPPPG